MDSRWLWRARAAAGRDWDLRRRFLWRGPAHTRDRSADGVGRKRKRRAWARTLGWVNRDRRGARDRLVARGGCNARDRLVSVWRRRDRSFDVRGGAVVVGGCGAGCFLCSGATGSESGSSRGAALRVNLERGFTRIKTRI